MRDGASFLLILLKVITIFSPLKIFAPISAAAFAGRRGLRRLERGPSYDRIPNGAVLLLMFSVMVLLVGLDLGADFDTALRWPALRPMKALILVPTYNERENLPVLAAGVLAHRRHPDAGHRR